MSQQDGTSLFFYSARLLVHDYESGRFPYLRVHHSTGRVKRRVCDIVIVCVRAFFISMSVGVYRQRELRYLMDS